MIRWIVAIAALLCLSGCVTTEYVYRDRYYDRYDSYSYDDGHGGRVYVDRDSYYSPSYAGRGDYYIGADYGWYPSYYDYPAYYSVFWPLQRSWYDPYWYPNYYYGVTFFPRHYLNVGFSYGWPRYSHWYYSPYRYSWVDNYYDWRPWYGGHHHHNHYAPRYGSARNEAERLSRRADEGWDYGRNTAFRDRSTHWRERDERVSDSVRRTPYGTFGTTRSPSRDADYGSPGSARPDIGQRGFGVPNGGEVRRQDPGTRGFGVPVDARGDSGHAGRGEQGESMRELRRRSYEEGLALPGSAAAPRESAGYQRYSRESEAMREARSRRGYDAGEAPRGGWTRPQRAAPAREYTQREYAPAAGGYDAAPRYEAPARGYEAPARGYDSGARAAPSFSAPPQQSYSPPEPSYRESPRFESRGSDFGGRSESRSESRSDGGSRGEVRRVGNNRDD